MRLEEADFSALFAAGYQFPEPFTVKAADGITDLYGVMYKPYDFDPNRVYPIVAYVYPGPQTESVSKAFSTNAPEQGLAQFGMIVVTVGNRGGHPDRSKWYHNFGYGNLRDYGLADKKAALEHLADRHTFVDLERVGIYGHSGGGFMSTAAMLVYPDFFKVGISESGNHDQRNYEDDWGERYQGLLVRKDGTDNYDIEANQNLAGNLKGKLMLAHGGMDNNVPPYNTYLVVDALIKANKDFDLIIFPNAGHGFGGDSNYMMRRRWDYFVQHLLGATPPGEWAPRSGQ
jgi:dipeptidyl aminopeptidase/acylaminoacyl peptidase